MGILLLICSKLSYDIIQILGGDFMKKFLASLIKTLSVLMLVFVMIPSFIILILNYDKSRMK